MWSEFLNINKLVQTPRNNNDLFHDALGDVLLQNELEHPDNSY